MKKIYIKTTETCNLQCDHCYIGDNRKVQGFFSEDLTINWIKDYIGFSNINERDIRFSFHGGEPLLCPLGKMQKVIDTFPNATYDTTTNLCYILNYEKLKFIKDNFIDKYETNRPFIKTSWDYKIRFHSNENKSIWESNIRLLLSEGVDVRVIICITSPLVSELKPVELMEYLLSLGIKDIHFERLTENTTADKSLIPNYNLQDEWLLEFYNVSKDKMIIDMFEEIKYACNHTFINCRARHCMRDVITINANGTIGGCPNSAISNYYTDISKPSSNIPNNDKRKSLIIIEQMRNVECFMCDIYEICNGDCHQLSWINGICASPKKLIRRIKDDLEREKKIILSNE